MGFYIETPVAQRKARWLMDNERAVRTLPPKKLSDIPDNLMLICVVSNGPFDAAGVVFSQGELDAFSYPDGRPRMWLLMDKARVHELCPRVKNAAEEQKEGFFHD